MTQTHPKTENIKMNILESISNFFTFRDLIVFVIGLIPSGYIIYKLVAFLTRKEIRLFNNLKRKVYVLSTDSSQSLQREKSLLQTNGFFTIHDEIISLSDIGVLETLNNSSVFVIGYSKSFKNYKEIISRAKRNSIPVVFFASPGEIIDEHMKLFREYPYFEMCNSTARLLTTIFNLCAISPNDKK